MTLNPMCFQPWQAAFQRGIINVEVLDWTTWNSSFASQEKKKQLNINFIHFQLIFYKCVKVYTYTSYCDNFGWLALSIDHSYSQENHFPWIVSPLNTTCTMLLLANVCVSSSIAIFYRWGRARQMKCTTRSNSPGNVWTAVLNQLFLSGTLSWNNEPKHFSL